MSDDNNPESLFELIQKMKPGDKVEVTVEGKTHTIIAPDAEPPAPPPGVDIPTLLDRWWRAGNFDGPRTIELAFDPNHGAFFGLRHLGAGDQLETLSTTEMYEDPAKVFQELAGHIVREAGLGELGPADVAPCAQIPRSLIDALRAPVGGLVPRFLTMARARGAEVERGEPYEYEGKDGRTWKDNVGAPTGKRFAIFTARMNRRGSSYAGDHERTIAAALAALDKRVTADVLAPADSGG